MINKILVAKYDFFVHMEKVHQPYHLDLEKQQ